MAVGLDQFVAEAAPRDVHTFMEGMGGVVCDGQQFWLASSAPPLPPGWPTENRRPTLFSSLFSPLGSFAYAVLCPSTEQHSKEDGAHHNKLIKHWEHPVACKNHLLILCKEIVDQILSVFHLVIAWFCKVFPGGL